MSDRLDRAYHWLANHLPRRLVYWCAIVVGAHATTGKYSHVNTPSLLFMDALKRWYATEPEPEPESTYDSIHHCDDHE